MPDTPEELTMLPEGWDGYKGKPVTLSNCNLAIRISEALFYAMKSEPKFVPCPDGGIQIEYHEPEKLVEIFICDHTTPEQGGGNEL